MDRLTEVDEADCEYQKDVIEIEGVVSPSGQGGWPRSDDYDVHCFSFSAWRRPEQSVVRSELTILRPVDRDGDCYSDYPKLSIHRIKVLLSVDETRAIFAGASTTVADTNQLSDVAAELGKPVIIKTEVFGELTLNRSINRFEGKAMWNGKAVEISFSTDETQDISAGLKVAEKLWAEQSSWKQRVEDYAVGELLSTKNDFWLDDDETPVTPEQFKSRMTLESISIDRKGGFSFWHDDGDLFYGHSVQVSGSLDEGLTQADIPG
jgi:hypothetical protein